MTTMRKMLVHHGINLASKVLAENYVGLQLD
jgi:hypothetical protein